jgi:hypothetical protein
MHPDQNVAKKRAKADQMADEENAAEGYFFLLSLEFGIAEAQKHSIRNDGDAEESLMAE